VAVRPESSSFNAGPPRSDRRGGVSGWLARLALASFATVMSAGDRRASILIFHRVTREPDPLFPDEMHAARFDAVMSMLASNFNVVRLGELPDRLARQTVPRRAVSITFDDGYADNYTVACPILKRHGLHATFFVASGFLDGGVMWNDEVIAALRGCRLPELDLAWLGLGRVALGPAAARRDAIESILRKLKYLSLAQRRETLDRLWSQAGGAPPRDLMLSTEQLRALRSEGMDIGGHTKAHPILAVLSASEAEEQIVGDRTRLTNLLGEAPRLFAYPNGKPGADYARSHVDLVRNAGYEAAFSTAPGSAGRDSDLFQLPRFTPWDSQPSRFAFRLAHNALRRNAAKV